MKGKSEYSSDDGIRQASINIENGAYIVTLYEGDEVFRETVDKEHSLQYWEDCCENWVKYWGEFSK